MKGFQEQFSQVGVNFDNICNLLGEDPSTHTGEEIEEDGGMSPIRKGWQSGSNPDLRRYLQRPNLLILILRLILSLYGEALHRTYKEIAQVRR